MCCKADEHIKHIVLQSTTLAPSEYANRHNKMVVVYIQWTVCKLVELHVTNRYCGHIPERVINVKYTTIMWDIPVVTDPTILAN